jgi:transcriptional regulator with XRE-family HTH domain
VSRSYLSEIEKGTKTPSLDMLDKYADEFGIPRSSILFFSEALPHAKKGETARRAIASKVLDILKFIERRSDAEDAPI